jgi:hypothetical protein
VKIISPLEIEEQRIFVQEVKLSYRLRSDFLELLFFATFNGEIYKSMGKVEHAGLVNGVSDILYLQARGGYAFFSCELKRVNRKNEKDGGVTPDERAWMLEARKAGAHVTVAYGADEALQLFANYMGMTAVSLHTWPPDEFLNDNFG